MERATSDKAIFTKARARPALLVAVFLGWSLVLTLAMTADFTARRGGILYPLDDSYIHLALARTLAEHGVWGLHFDEPAAASSSPLWTVLLATAAKLTPGSSRTTFSWVPLVANVMAGTALVLFWRRRLADTRLPSLATLALIAIVPLPAIALIGMEHVLHIVLATMLAWLAAKVLQPDAPYERWQLAVLAALSALAVAARYESLALIVAVALLAGRHRRWLVVPAMLVPAAAVIAGFGALWVRSGGWLVPNALLLKPQITLDTGGGWITRLLSRALSVWWTPSGATVLALSLALALVWLALRTRPGPVRSLVVLALACNGAQLLFGDMGWLFRYEAWLIALDGLALLLAADVLLKDKRHMFLVVVALFALCGYRAALSLSFTPRAAQDRDWEHFGPTDALASYVGQPLLVNDVGVVSYYGAGRPIDVYGLADNQILRYKRQGRFGPKDVRALAQREGAHIAMFQICWNEINRRLPEGWRLVEAWTGPRNVVFTDLTVAFMADTPAAAERLRATLARARAPVNVWRYTGASQMVRDFNAAADKGGAARTLCYLAPMKLRPLSG